MGKSLKVGGGLHTHDGRLKVNIDEPLLLEPGQEREGEIISEVADRHIAPLEGAFAALLRYVLAGQSQAAMMQRAESLPLAGLVDATVPLLVDGGTQGVRVVSEIIERLAAPGFEITYAENYVARWARNYSYRLVRGIDAVSRDVLQRHISQWAQTGEALPKLEERLAPWFGQARAKRIAITESTRAYAEGTFTGYEAAGFAPRPLPEKRPPEHPNCRCFVSVARDGGTWVYVWYTANDELVCPLCRPRHLEVIGQAGSPGF